MGIVRAILARTIRFGLDGLQGPTNEQARAILERRPEQAEARRLSEVTGLGQQLAEAVEQRDEARKDYHAAVDRALEAHRVLGANHNEGTLEAAKRVVAERDAAEARIAKAEAVAGVSLEAVRKELAGFAEGESKVKLAELVVALEKVASDARRADRCEEEIARKDKRIQELEMRACALRKELAGFAEGESKVKLAERRAMWRARCEEVERRYDLIVTGLRQIVGGQDELLRAVRRIKAEHDLRGVELEKLKSQHAPPSGLLKRVAMAGAQVSIDKVPGPSWTISLIRGRGHQRLLGNHVLPDQIDAELDRLLKEIGA